MKRLLVPVIAAAVVGLTAVGCAPTPRPPATLDEACTPEVNLNLEDTGTGGQLFMSSLDNRPVPVVQALGRQVCSVLYRKASEPPLASRMTLWIRNAPGEVAWKAGDGNNIIVMISTDHLLRVKAEGSDVTAEIKGILAHEMTHMYQNDDRDHRGAPLGLIEGVADFVRIKLGYQPAHVAGPTKGGTWDAGYTTTAFFLLWIEDLRPGFMYELNQSMSSTDGKAWTTGEFQRITGTSLSTLWSQYQATL